MQADCFFQSDSTQLCNVVADDGMPVPGVEVPTTYPKQASMNCIFFSYMYHRLRSSDSKIQFQAECGRQKPTRRRRRLHTRFKLF